MAAEKPVNRTARQTIMASEMLRDHTTTEVVAALEAEFKISNRYAYKIVKRARKRMSDAWDWQDRKAFAAAAIHRLEQYERAAAIGETQAIVQRTGKVVTLYQPDWKAAIAAIKAQAELFGMTAENAAKMAAEGLTRIEAAPTPEEQLRAFNAARRAYGIPPATEEQWAEMTNVGSARVN